MSRDNVVRTRYFHYVYDLSTCLHVKIAAAWAGSLLQLHLAILDTVLLNNRKFITLLYTHIGKNFTLIVYTFILVLFN